MQKVLVVGGAGYIGSHTVNQLIKQNLEVVVVDNLSTGSIKSIPQNVKFYQLDILNYSQLKEVFLIHNFSAVFHFAAKLSVPESFKNYFEYIDVNVVGTKNILKLCHEFAVENFIFSSTAAVYGEGRSSVVLESDTLNPQNPYGLTKKIAEDLIQQYSEIDTHFKFKILRYFNVAGAEVNQSNGPRNLNSGQLILNLCKSALSSTKEVQIYGQQFKTIDGTAIRDYIHVVDLAAAHVAAYRHLIREKKSTIWNCGYGKGYTVLEVVRAFEKANHIQFNLNYLPARAGDPAQVVSNNQRIITESDWCPQFDDLDVICKSTFEWVKNVI